jgi:hypothetical protein
MTRTLAATTMNDLRTAAQQALEALEKTHTQPGCEQWQAERKASVALRAALTQPEQEVKGCDHCNHPLFAAIKCRVCGLVTEQEPVAWTDRELQLIDGMIEVQLHHAAQCDGIANRTMAEKQKGWDMERVALLHKIKSISPRHEWQSLSEDELTALGVIHSRYQEESLETGGWFDFARAVEAALKERNNG